METNNTIDWCFEMERQLRNFTKNFDLDAEIYDYEDGEEVELPIDKIGYLMISGGMEHYVVFKDGASLDNNKGDFSADSYMYINLDEPINLDGGIAFKIDFDEE
jgi:hypothetical protein